MNDGTKLEDMTWNEFLFGLPEPNPYTFPIQTMRWFAMRGLLLTKKIEADYSKPLHIMTSHGKGYLFKSRTRSGKKDRRK